MLEAHQLPDLTFPMVELGRRETPWDLKPLLYQGGSAANAGKVANLISAGELGVPHLERVSLVQALHETITGKIVGGGSKDSQIGCIEAFRSFFTWAEEASQPLTLATVQITYLHWTDALLQRVRVRKEMTEQSAYHLAVRVGGTLDTILQRGIPLISLSRISKPARRKSVQGVQADKQNLEWTFAFGHFLQDICDGLPLSAIWGTLPARILLRNGGELEEWSGLAPPDKRPSTKGHISQIRYRLRKKEKAREAYTNEHTMRTRYPLVNLRIEAELLMFIGQTGMNLSQAHQLKLRHFFFSSDIDGYKVKDHKKRRGGEVLFEIYKEYRAHFERYLDWRREIAPGDDRLFPFALRSRLDSASSQLSRTRKTCKKLGIQFVAPSALRKTRINWLLRRSGDLDMTAEMAQHTKETLLTSYEVPSLQRAMTETMRFWANADPALAARTIPVAPGECDGVPVPVKDIPKGVAEPDCVRASGCLWCEHHRDVDSQDYVWSLGCFRHLKVIELSKYRAPEQSLSPHPAEHAVTRLSDKLRWFLESNAKRRGWVEEALARVEEGNYHPDWVRLLEDVEGIEA